MHRRTFVTSTLSTLAFPAIAALHERDDAALAQAPARARAFVVRAGEDRQGHPLVLAGVRPNQRKISTQDSAGALLLLEGRCTGKRGVVRHVHFEQDEWWYVINGEFAVEIGGEMFRLHAGDLVFGPRNVPHSWACVGDTPATILTGLQPALTFERFLDRLGALSKPLEGDALKRLFADHGMEVVGPPLEVR